VNNAGISRAGAIEAMPLDDYLAVVNVNQVGCFLGMQAAIPALGARAAARSSTSRRSRACAAWPAWAPTARASSRSAA
jgi:NAD(P)-dependent dehydrogenase (short-subunit alcohol dehydrogenase family)